MTTEARKKVIRESVEASRSTLRELKAEAFTADERVMVELITELYKLIIELTEPDPQGR